MATTDELLDALMKKVTVPRDRDSSFEPTIFLKGESRFTKEKDFHGKKLKNDTHESTTDPDAKLFKKSAGKEKEGKLSYMAYALMDDSST